MTTTPTVTNSRARRVARRTRRIWGELSYAQRRMFEIRTGLPPAEPRAEMSAAELERHFQLELPRAA